MTDQLAKRELVPCPDCGASARCYRVFKGYVAFCTSIWCRLTGVKESYQGAVDAWNTGDTYKDAPPALGKTKG